jgi:hypothetical protein
MKQQRDERWVVPGYPALLRSDDDAERAQGNYPSQSVILYARKGERHKELVTPESGPVSVGFLAKQVPDQIAGQRGGER